MYRREFVFILPTLSLLPKTYYISSVNSLSFSLDIYSVSLHIYVNLIYLHFIVIYGLLCDFINMFCTEVTSRCISVLRSLSALSALSTRTWRVRSSVSRPAPHAGRLFHSLLFAWFWFVSLSDNNYSTSTFYIWVSLLGTLRLIWALVIQRRHSALRRSPSHAGGYSAQTSFIHPLKHVGAASWSRAPPQNYWNWPEVGWVRRIAGFVDRVNEGVFPGLGDFRERERCWSWPNAEAPYLSRQMTCGPCGWIHRPRRRRPNHSYQTLSRAARTVTAATGWACRHLHAAVCTAGLRFPQVSHLAGDAGAHTHKKKNDSVRLAWHWVACGRLSRSPRPVESPATWHRAPPPVCAGECHDRCHAVSQIAWLGSGSSPWCPLAVWFQTKKLAVWFPWPSQLALEHHLDLPWCRAYSSWCVTPVVSESQTGTLFALPARFIQIRIVRTDFVFPEYGHYFHVQLFNFLQLLIDTFHLHLDEARFEFFSIQLLQSNGDYSFQVPTLRFHRFQYFFRFDVRHLRVWLFDNVWIFICLCFLFICIHVICSLITQYYVWSMNF